MISKANTPDGPGEQRSVAAAVAELTGLAARFVERIPVGEVNRVYKVETTGGVFVVKVFQYPDWPEAGKLQWVERQLNERGVAHPPLIHYTRDERLFPHGFAAFEYVEGRNCLEALSAGELSAADYCRLAGEYLRKVHAIRVSRYGYIGHGSGTDDDYIECKLTHDVDERLRAVGDDVHARLFPPIAEEVERLLRPLEERFTPRLLHGDAFPGNGLLIDERRLILVDWDEAMSGIWPEDLARLAYWFACPNPPRGDAGLTNEQVIDFLLRGYGDTEFHPEELGRAVRALHLVYSADLLSYRHQTNNTESYARIMNVIEELLAERSC